MFGLLRDQPTERRGVTVWRGTVHLNKYLLEGLGGVPVSCRRPLAARVMTSSLAVKRCEALVSMFVRIRENIQESRDG